MCLRAEMRVRGGREEARDDTDVLHGRWPCTSTGFAVALTTGEADCGSCGVGADERADCPKGLFDVKR
jgi:hypothetical protein